MQGPIGHIETRLYGLLPGSQVVIPSQPCAAGVEPFDSEFIQVDSTLNPVIHS